LKEYLGAEAVAIDVDVIAGADSMGTAAVLGLGGPRCTHGCNFCERETVNFSNGDDLEKDQPRSLARLRFGSHLYVCPACPHCGLEIVDEKDFHDSSKQMVRASPGDPTPAVPKSILGA
jgi:hypothetical protein